jgi:hypothetical protein
MYIYCSICGRHCDEEEIGDIESEICIYCLSDDDILDY